MPKIYFSYLLILYTEKKCTQLLNISKIWTCFFECNVYRVGLTTVTNVTIFFPTMYIINITVEKENT